MEKNIWLKDHNYTVLGIFAGDVESDIASTLDRIAAAVG
jgi:hypothetical protein